MGLIASKGGFTEIKHTVITVLTEERAAENPFINTVMISIDDPTIWAEALTKRADDYKGPVQCSKSAFLKHKGTAQDWEAKLQVGVPAADNYIVYMKEKKEKRKGKKVRSRSRELTPVDMELMQRMNECESRFDDQTNLHIRVANLENIISKMEGK
jgi:hypothetical protein